LIRYAPSVRRARRQYASAEATRATMAALAAEPADSKPPGRMRRRVSVAERGDGAGWLVYEVAPRRGEAVATVLFLHGGAYFREIRGWHWKLVAHLARTVPARVVVPIYELAPSGTAASVVPAALALAEGLAGAGLPFFLVGDSAGAGMALAVAQELFARAAAPAGLVLISPWADISCTDPGLEERARRDPWLQPAGLAAAGEAYRGSLPADHPWVSPLFGELAGVGPVLVFSGTDDILNADAQRLVRALLAAGERVEFVEAAGMIHDYPLQPTPEGRAARRVMTSWLKARIADLGR
jgi:acetyl esterase/lipase